MRPACPAHSAFTAETIPRIVSQTPFTQNWMRDYDPTTGRYIQADPLGLVDGASVYGYALQNPGRYTDPTGEVIPAAILGGMAVGFGMGLLEELWRNEWQLRCVNWNVIGFSTAFEAAGGAFSWGSKKWLREPSPVEELVFSFTQIQGQNGIA